MFSVWKRIPLLYQFSEDFKLRKNALRILQSETKRVIQMRRTQFDANGYATAKLSDSEDEQVLGVKRRQAFLDALLTTQRETGVLSNVDVQEEVDTFMFAVSEMRRIISQTV